MRHCINCKHYHILNRICGKDVSEFNTRAEDDWCAFHEITRETNAMKDKIVTKHEVRLSNQWYEVQPMFEKDNGIYFIDPRPKSSADLKQPPNQGILNGVRKVELLFVSFTSSGYRAEHYAHAYVNSETGEVEEYLEDRAEFPSPVKSGLKLAKIIFK